MEVVANRRLDDRDAQGDGEKAPDSRVFVGIGRQNIGNQRSDQIMETDKAPGSINNRQPEAYEDVDQRVKTPAE